jgi:hypothetical protein
VYPSQYEADHSENEECGLSAGEIFEAFGEPPASSEPAECPVDDPALGGDEAVTDGNWRRACRCPTNKAASSSNPPGTRNVESVKHPSGNRLGNDPRPNLAKAKGALVVDDVDANWGFQLLVKPFLMVFA